MAALLILNYDVTDRDGLDRYRDAARPVLLGPDRGIPVAISEKTVDLGEGTGVGANTVVLRFGSVATARATYESDAYQDLLGARLRATTPRFSLIVETME